MRNRLDRVSKVPGSIWIRRGTVCCILLIVITSCFCLPRIPTRPWSFLSPYHRFLTQHASLFPLDSSDYLGFFLAFIGLFLAAGGGIGGGGILVPIYILMLHFRPKYAIPLSNTTVLGGSIANTWINSYKRHPYADRPLIDWDFILLMEPLTIAGALVGALLNKLLPEDKVVILLVLLLCATAYTTFRKAFQMYHKESLRIKRQEQSILQQYIYDQEQDAQQEEMMELIATTDAPDRQLDENHIHDTEIQKPESESESSTHPTTKPLDPEQVRNTIMQQEQEVPKNNVKILIILFLVVLVTNVAKGGSTGSFPSPLGITCGSTLFWLANILMLLFILYITFISRLYLLSRFESKQSCGYIYVEGDIIWNPRTTLIYPMICFAAGFFSGMFGIGGGIVFGPLMLALGMPPEVSSATSACMILFTSLTATTSFLVFGLLVLDYAIFCFVLGFISTWIGQVALTLLLKNNPRKSYIAFLIGGVVLISAFLMTIQSIISMAEGKGGGKQKEMGGICS
jgi:uncharacterized membrane protein YfcA